MCAADSILGLVLAAGGSSQMGLDKAVANLQGHPLIANMIDRLLPEVYASAISANGDASRFAAFGLPVLADVAADRNGGPLAAVVAGVAHADREGWPLAATAPCDAPFCADGLHRHIRGGDRRIRGVRKLLLKVRAVSSRCSPCGARLRVLRIGGAHLADGGCTPRAFPDITWRCASPLRAR